jgi:hypothetical protein
MNNPTPDLETLLLPAAATLGWLVAIAGWTTALMLWRKGCRTRAELNLIRRRAEAPCLVPSEAIFNFLYTTPGQGPIQGCSVASGCLLSHFRNEVEKKTEPGAAILLVIENRGREPRRAVLRLDGQPVRLGREPAVSDAHGLHYLEYPYDPVKHGQDQRLVIEFETDGGVQDRHAYVLKHGLRYLRRIDPP